MSMEAAAAATSVGAEFGPQLHPALGFRHSQRRALPCWRLRPPRPASLRLCGGGGARPRGAIAAAADDQRRLGELEAQVEAEAGSVLGPPRSSPREVTPLLSPARPVPGLSSLTIPAPWTHSWAPGCLCR
jgi:hypothetical protein